MFKVTAHPVHIDTRLLPDNDDDKIYAGDYFPRRFPSDNQSLEYLDFYQRQAGEKTIALVAGIFETEENAGSVLTVLHKTEKKVFKIKADIYVDCNALTDKVVRKKSTFKKIPKVL